MESQDDIKEVDDSTLQALTLTIKVQVLTRKGEKEGK